MRNTISFLQVLQHLTTKTFVTVIKLYIFTRKIGPRINFFAPLFFVQLGALSTESCLQQVFVFAAVAPCNLDNRSILIEAAAVELK